MLTLHYTLASLQVDTLSLLLWPGTADRHHDKYSREQREQHATHWHREVSELPEPHSSRRPSIHCNIILYKTYGGSHAVAPSGHLRTRRICCEGKGGREGGGRHRGGGEDVGVRDEVSDLSPVTPPTPLPLSLPPPPTTLGGDPPGTPLLPRPSFLLYPLPESRAVASGINLVAMLLGSFLPSEVVLIWNILKDAPR